MNDLIPEITDLGARINEAHRLAIQYAGKAIEHAIACGQMLLEAKAKVPHGKWLPWLRENITFGERSAQGYMRIAQKVPHQIRNGVADFTSLRGALAALATPRRYRREEFDAEMLPFLAHIDAVRSGRPDDPKGWSPTDARNCADLIRGIDAILHKHGLCVQTDCTVCDALGLNGPEYVPPEPWRSQLITAV
jgi:hypothetical protein